MPGEPEALNEQVRREKGIPLTPDVVASLEREGKRAGMPFPSTV
jgi:LDH2 family malate/lactate/ureidoglycolate dehydrogenase